MKLDLQQIPFSYCGSYFAVSIVEGTLYIRDVHGGDETDSTLFAVLIDGHEKITDAEFLENYWLKVTEEFILCEHKVDSDVYLCIKFSNEDTLQIKTNALSVVLQAIKTRYDTFYQLDDYIYEYISYKKDQRYAICLSTGKLKIDAPWNKVGNEKIILKTNQIGETCFDLVNYKVAMRKEGLQELRNKEKFSLSDFRKVFLNEEMVLSEPFDMATYLMWSNQVKPSGLLTNRSVYMSKNLMQNIWSWDNCFAALALAKYYPRMAYEQLQLFFYYQDKTGAYPDFINDKTISYSCVKPPIYGLTYQALWKRNDYFLKHEILEEAYESIAKNTFYWLRYRVHPVTGLLYYTHGNDSGWDNASIFHEGMPVASPDLLAFLIRQCEFLEQASKRLSNGKEKYWLQKKEEIQEYLLKEFYQEDKKRFVAKNARTGEVIANQNSLILTMPLVAWDFLPIQVVDQLVDTLVKEFETKFGFATEKVTSKLYQGDGYWLGPIWAPVSYLLLDSLKSAGYKKEYERLKEKYFSLVEVGGMAENYNAINGSGNDDLGFTWSSAVYLLLIE